MNVMVKKLYTHTHVREKQMKPRKTEAKTLESAFLALTHTLDDDVKVGIKSKFH